MDWLSGSDLYTRYVVKDANCCSKEHSNRMARNRNVIIYCCGLEIIDLTCATFGIYQMNKREISANIGNDSKNISSHNQILFLTAITCETFYKITDLSMFFSLKLN